MDNKNRFQEMLGDILEVARVQGNQLGMNEIKSLFGDMNLSEAQYEHIFAYLAANQIKIKGYVATESEYTKAVRKEAESSEETDYIKEEEKDDENEIKPSSHNHSEDSAYLKMYMEDLSGIKESTPEEDSLLINKIIQGDAFAKNRYIEGNLHSVVRIAEDYRNQGVTMEDLIQEGNIGLITSLEIVAELKTPEQGKDTVTGYIRKYMEAAIAEQNESSSFENIMIKKMDYIREAANDLAEDLGREANIHELAEFVKMPEEEVIDILNMTTDGVKVDNKHGHAGEAQHSEGHGHNHNHTDHRH